MADKGGSRYNPNANGNRHIARNHKFKVAAEVRDVIAGPLGFPAKKCPVCGLQAPTKYFDEKNRRYVYRHPRQYRETIEHYAEY